MTEAIALGALMSRGARGDPRLLLAMVFGAASVTTAALSLDATIVLLTPIVFATAARLRADPRPQVYACSHLANSASLLLPVSNLTNLLALTATGLSFPRFAGLMVLPWLVAIGVEWLVLRRSFAGQLRRSPGATPDGTEVALPRRALVVIALTLAGFAASSALGIAAISAVAANLLNNLPATLIILPALAGAGPVAVLAMLIGVGVGPNLTYVGSLATLLWRRILHEHDETVDLSEFLRLGVLTVPVSLVLCTAALWAAAQVI